MTALLVIAIVLASVVAYAIIAGITLRLIAHKTWSDIDQVSAACWWPCVLIGYVCYAFAHHVVRPVFLFAARPRPRRVKLPAMRVVGKEGS